MENTTKRINEQEAAELLLCADNLLILCHAKPDGDTLGSGFGLLRALRGLDKRAHILCADGFGPRYSFLYEGMEPGSPEGFAPEFVVAVDVADPQLLGGVGAAWGDKCDLCIDHHPSNLRYAKHLLLDGQAAATAQVMARVLDAMGAPITPEIATALFTGLSTDTGCFRYSSVTAGVHRLAARLLDDGADGYMVNKRMFETKSPARLRVEQMVMDTLEYRLDGRFALLAIMQDAVRETGVAEEELEGISAIPRQIEGVRLAATLRQRGENRFKVSMRSGLGVDSSRICQRFGGGGHARAAGCIIEAPLEEAKDLLTQAALEALETAGQMN